MSHSDVSSLYIIGGRVSELPIFWEAESGEKKFCQIGEDGKVALHHTALPERLSYFGLRCTRGAWGLTEKPGICSAGVETFSVGPYEGPATYLRRVILDCSQGTQLTMLSEVGLGPWRLRVQLLPTFQVSFSCDGDEILVEMLSKTGGTHGCL